jgi:hypothetical protein
MDFLLKMKLVKRFNFKNYIVNKRQLLFLLEFFSVTYVEILF